MITVKYDDRLYKSCPDGLVEDLVKDCVVDHRENGDVTICTSSSLVIDQFKNYVAKGIILQTEIEVVFEGEILEINEYGAITPWPKGFLEHAFDLSISTARIATIKRKEK